jgi:RimJ/RimL family protein N-acetyltransferase
MKTSESQHYEQGVTEIQSLGDFDMQYFQELEGQNGWLALGQENCMNQCYFTVYSSNNEKLGIVGVYDTEHDKNVTHTVVDPKYRGQGLAAKFKQRLMDELNLPFVTMTIDLGNTASIRATEKLPGVRKISDEQYEHDFHKVKYIYERPAQDQAE